MSYVNYFNYAQTGWNGHALVKMDMHWLKWTCIDSSSVADRSDPAVLFHFSISSIQHICIFSWVLTSGIKLHRYESNFYRYLGHHNSQDWSIHFSNFKLKLRLCAKNFKHSLNHNILRLFSIIIWTNAGSFLTGILDTKFSEIWITT